ncbi:MAG: DUF4368 domain-containing protein [Clostridia bacterium]|nr:DUF4368 domain-containing protein [Clostridia bacterium]
MMLICKYSNFEALTPEILRSFICKVIVHEKTKVKTVEIVYNFVEQLPRGSLTTTKIINTGN